MILVCNFFIFHCAFDFNKIFNISDSRNVTATVVYNNSQSAAYARDKIHGLEYPPGERLIIRLGHENVGGGGMSSQNDSFNGKIRSLFYISFLVTTETFFIFRISRTSPTTTHGRQSGKLCTTMLCRLCSQGITSQCFETNILQGWRFD